MKVVIIGGVAGGAGTASRIKRLCEHCEVLVLEKGEFVSFANCGLPYHIGGVISQRNQLILQTPESLRRRSDIGVRTGHEALSIHPSQKRVEVKDLSSGEIYSESYDTLVLATGSSPIKPPIEGIDDPAVQTLWTIPDMDALMGAVKGGKKRAAVVGGGFIGLETAENLKKAGHDVVIIEKMPRVLASLDGEMAAHVEKELEKQGIRLYLGQGLNKIEREGETLRLHLENAQITADLVVMAAGVRPNSRLAREAGLELNGQGGIVVNLYLQTSDPNIYAVGDAIETHNIATGRNGVVPLAGPATRQGRLAAENILGGKKAYGGVNPTSICKVFSLEAASTGASERDLQGGKYHRVYVHPANHPSYYPGAQTMHIKLLYDGGGTVLGAQIVGGKGVDKRIDIFSLAVRQKLSVYDLAEQDFAYAPPFGSPRDPVHVAAFAAINQLEGLSVPAFAEDIKDSLILDVREPSEVEEWPIEGAKHIPLGELRGRIGELDRGAPLLVVCASGLRSYLAERILRQRGFKIKNFSGGCSCLRMIP